VIGFVINDITEIFTRVPYCSVIAFVCYPVSDVYHRPVCRLVYSEITLTLFTKYSIPPRIGKLHGYTVHKIMLNTFYYQLTHTTLKNVELLKHSKIDKNS